jgi:hypothetical protein
MHALAAGTRVLRVLRTGDPNLTLICITIRSFFAAL